MSFVIWGGPVQYRERLRRRRSARPDTHRESSPLEDRATSQSSVHFQCTLDTVEVSKWRRSPLGVLRPCGSEVTSRHVRELATSALLPTLGIYQPYSIGSLYLYFKTRLTVGVQTCCWRTSSSELRQATIPCISKSGISPDVSSGEGQRKPGAHLT